MNKDNEERVKEVYIQTEEGQEEPERYISYTLIACSAVVVAILILILVIQLLVGWGPIFEKIFKVLNIA